MSRRLASRNTSVVSSRGGYIPQPDGEGLILPSGPVGEQAVDILHDIVHPAHELTLVDQDGSSHLDLEDEEHDEEVTAWKALPWWKRPSPYWLIFGTPLASLGTSITIAPRVELYTVLACRVHAPEYERNNIHPTLFEPYSMSSTNTTGIQHGFTTLDVSISAHESIQPMFLYVPTSPSPSQEHDTDRNQCASNSAVQAAVAKLSAVLVTSMGVLSFLTTAWWGSLSDRLGRIPVMGFSMLGLLANELIFIITAFFFDHLPGGYWFLVVGFVLEGSLGGMSTGIAASHAYLADSTHHSERSRIFSLALGTMFGGIALGPVIGGISIRATGSTLAPFYLAAAAHGLYATYIFLIVPESQSKARATGARQRRQISLERRQGGLSRVQVILKSLVQFLSPLAVLLPERVIIDGNPLKRSKRDWSLCYIAISYGIATSLMSLIPYTLQYVTGTFRWSPEYISYLVAFIGISRALFLAVILPVMIKFLKPAPVQLPTSPDEPLQESPASQGAAKALHSPKFDLNLARLSLILDIISYLVQGLTSNGTLFACAVGMLSLATGYSPALQAFALEIYGRRGGKGETGKLFGAFSVVQALGSQVLGPALYGFIYYKTVATFPRAIFLVTAVFMTVSLVLLALVHPPTTGEDDIEGVRSGDGTQAPDIHYE